MRRAGFFEELLEYTERKYPEKGTEIRKKAEELLEEYCSSEKKKPYAITVHTVERIFPCIAIYKSISELADDKKGAYQIVSDCFEEICKKRTAPIRRLCRFPFLYHFVPYAAAKFVKKNFAVKSGFHMKVRKVNREECHIDMVGCPYHNYCKIYECEELTTAFCSADDVAFEHLHKNVSWDRTKALGRGDRCCDFIFRVDR
ncbi:MAG: L-2-amino-thiazoline-4-carboxylic acid hydrolase [Lachnospiraceae bacterium]|nr:L-2-amino-thiazoline-4-carboxylic acid hydrolase [Lachnospiraceae bacterium]